MPKDIHNQGEGGGWPVRDNIEIFPPGHPALSEKPAPAPQGSNYSTVFSKQPEQWPTRGHIRDSGPSPIGENHFVFGC